MSRLDRRLLRCARPVVSFNVDQLCYAGPDHCPPSPGLISTTSSVLSVTNRLACGDSRLAGISQPWRSNSTNRHCNNHHREIRCALDGASRARYRMQRVQGSAPGPRWKPRPLSLPQVRALAPGRHAAPAYVGGSLVWPQRRYVSDAHAQATVYRKRLVNRRPGAVLDYGTGIE